MAYYYKISTQTISVYENLYDVKAFNIEKIVVLCYDMNNVIDALFQSID